MTTSTARKGKKEFDKTAWLAEKQAQTKGLIATIQSSVEAIHTSDDFKARLRFMGAFHQYSINNQFLIAAQCPHATHIAGYETWKKLKRQVRKGERGIWILAPRPFVKDEVDANGEKIVGMSFKAVSVFDISQTDGEPIPELPKPALLTGDEALDPYEAVVAWVENTVGLSVTGWDVRTGGDDSKSTYNGYYDPAHGVIFVKHASINQMFKTLLHEIAHHFDPDLLGSTEGFRETVAEAVAFIVANAVGIDTSAYSFRYIAGWSAAEKGTETIKAALDRITKIVHQMLEPLAAYAETVTA